MPGLLRKKKRKKSLLQIDREMMKLSYRNYPVSFLKEKTDSSIVVYNDYQADLSKNFERHGRSSYRKCYKTKLRVGKMHGAI